MDKQEYINELYARYSDKVYAVCMKYLHNEDDAQDIMHDTYITAMNKICGLRKPEKAEKWLCAVAANKCKDYIRKNKPMFDSDGYEYENAAEETYSAENAVIDESVKNDLREIVNSLPTSQKNVVAGFYFESLSVKELARALSCTQSSVKVSLHRARKTIKSKCEQKGITLGGCALGAALTTAAKDAGIKFAASTAVGAGIAVKVVSCIAVAAIVVYGAVGVAHYSGMEIGVFSDSAPEQGDTASGNGDFRYTVYGEDDEYVKIAQYDGDSEAVEFPSEINGAAVKALGDDSLILHPEKVKKVIIPEGVEMIFGNFSGCVNLSEIVLPDTIKYISDKAFCDTAYYKNDENRENGVLYIGKYLIDGKKQVKSDKSSSEYFDEECVSGNVKVKDATLCIAENAFADCDKIASVTMSNSVKYIGSGAFARCTGLSSIKLSDNLTSVENGVFDGCKNLNDISLPKSITSVGESAFCDTGIYNNPNNW